MTPEPEERRTVLLTGAAGRIGSAFRAHASDCYQFRLADRSVERLTGSEEAGHEVMAMDIADLTACQNACSGIDTVVHLAADPSPHAGFYESLLKNNVKGTYNIFRAAADQGCRRVIFASSIHAVFGHPPDVHVRPESAVWPIDMYGVTKCFGEAVAACFAAGGLSSIAVRIGAYHGEWVKTNPTPKMLSIYVSPRDLNQLLVRCVEATDIEFAIVHGVSNNRVTRLDLSATRDLLGYAPDDDGFRLFETGDAG